MSKGPEAFRTISEVAEDLDLPQHVLRFWETRFAQIKPLKRGGGRRYYRPDDVDLLRGIRQLLYGEGYTIKGVQRILKEQGPRFVIGAGRGETEGLSAAARRSPSDDFTDTEDDIAVEGDVDWAGADFDDDDDDEMPAAPQPRVAEPLVSPPRQAQGTAPGVHQATSPAKAALDAEEIGRLRAALTELVECKRLLEQAA